MAESTVATYSIRTQRSFGKSSSVQIGCQWLRYVVISHNASPGLFWPLLSTVTQISSWSADCPLHFHRYREAKNLQIHGSPHCGIGFTSSPVWIGNLHEITDVRLLIVINWNSNMVWKSVIYILSSRYFTTLFPLCTVKRITFYKILRSFNKIFIFSYKTCYYLYHPSTWINLWNYLSFLSRNNRQTHWCKLLCPGYRYYVVYLFFKQYSSNSVCLFMDMTVYVRP